MIKNATIPGKSNAISRMLIVCGGIIFVAVCTWWYLRDRSVSSRINADWAGFGLFWKTTADGTLKNRFNGANKKVGHKQLRNHSK